ncbi:MAG: DUF47 family protein [Actinomyces sp.]|uniref:DUF47 domain-containing protein n=1 Tax=Schaalia naturae TaxID=635203 RepID=A0ABW2SHS9_9ACTO|nr:DUF47 family protein [Actinomyces sp.]MCI1642627.1 DUF47 family protein [Actinomyces sp.]MCI1691814.1 DUF47 family protein [Actinomyces sp.]MCI1787202.1 DUF47 family protein [Actinomyces sp.]MCI1829596.1 DUF47 family protein [Actinomyces sp.]MCI1866846.1 DUF47 family protein [Actinomyces sp.]
MGLRSPEGPTFFDLLSAQADQLVTGVGLLATMLGASPEERVALRDQLHEVEHAGDEVNHQVVRRLNLSFVTPFDREDLGFLAARLDDCMDLMDEAGDLIVLYGLNEIPDDVSELIAHQVDVLTRCADQTAKAMPGLKSPLDLREYWVEINRLENEGDQAYRRTLTTLFDSGLDPVMIIKLKDVIEVLESCADAFEDFANGIESIAVKES